MTALTWLPPPCNVKEVNALRAWLSDLLEKITDTGLIQTSDTGQLVPATVPLPTTGSNSGSVQIGYWIFRFDDDMQAVAPIFLRVEIRVSGSAGDHIPVFSVTIGTGTDGAGAITGLQTTLNSTGDITTGSSLPSLTVNSASSICYSPERGFFGILYQPGNYRDPSNRQVVRSPMAFFVSRTQLPNGEATDEGVSLYAQGSTSANSQSSNTWSNTYLQAAFIDFAVGVVTTAGSGTAVPTLSLPTIRDGKYVLQRAYHHGIGAPCHNLLLYPVSIGNADIEVVSGGTVPAMFKPLGTLWGGRPTSLTSDFALALLSE